MYRQDQSEDEELDYDNEPNLYREGSCFPPCLFEPEYSDLEMVNRLAERDRRRDAEKAAAARGEEEDPALLIPRDRTESTFWCSCGQCKVMEQTRDCVCCNEWMYAEPMIRELQCDQDLRDPGRDSDSEDPEPAVCVTDHRDLENHTNPGILTTFFKSPRINWSRNAQPEGPDGTLSDFAQNHTYICYLKKY